MARLLQSIRSGFFSIAAVLAYTCQRSVFRGFPIARLTLDVRKFSVGSEELERRALHQNCQM